VPIAGALIVLFAIEQIVNGWRIGFEGPKTPMTSRGSLMSNGAILLLMTALFLGFGYMGVPVAFALMAGVLVACGLTPISMQSMVGRCSTASTQRSCWRCPSSCWSAS
jgi:hypothetical protein